MYNQTQRYTQRPAVMKGLHELLKLNTCLTRCKAQSTTKEEVYQKSQMQLLWIPSKWLIAFFNSFVIFAIKPQDLHKI